MASLAWLVFGTSQQLELIWSCLLGLEAGLWGRVLAFLHIAAWASSQHGNQILRRAVPQASVQIGRKQKSTIFFFFYVFICFQFWLHCVFVALSGLSLVAVSRGSSSLQCLSFLLWWLLLLRCMGLVVPQHVESSWPRDQTCAPFICRQIPIHCATKEVCQHS